MEEGELSGGDEILVTDLKLSILGSPNPGTAGRANLLARKKWSGCVKFDDFRLEEKVGEGTFGVVHKAVHRRTGKMVALKKILTRPEQEGFPITALREIKLLKLVRHPNTMSISGIAVTSNNTADDGGVYMVFDYMDHDLTGLLESPEIRFSIPQIKLYMKQLLSGLKYLHGVDILHRDIKGANLLLNNNGELKITDFGLARPVEEGRVHYTPGVVTRWYRPPELLFGATKYGPSVDVWGAGCILGEMLIKKPLLPGESDLHQLELIAQLCGTPSEETMPGCSSLPDFAKVRLPMCKRRILDAFAKPDRLAADLMDKLLQLDPAKRLTASQALEHEFFKSAPPAALPSDLPVYPSKHEFTCQRAAPENEASRQLHDAPHPTPHRHGQNSFENSPMPPPPPPLPGHRYMVVSKDSRSRGRDEPARERDLSRDRRHRSRSRERTRSRDRRDHSRDRRERDRSRDYSDRKDTDRGKERCDVETEKVKPVEKKSEPTRRLSPRPRSPPSPERRPRDRSRERPRPRSPRRSSPLPPPPAPIMPYSARPQAPPDPALIARYYHHDDYHPRYDERGRGHGYDDRRDYAPPAHYGDDRRRHHSRPHYDDHPRHHHDKLYRPSSHKRPIQNYSGVDYHTTPSKPASQSYDMYGLDEPEPKRHESSRRSSDAGKQSEKSAKIPTYTSDVPK